MIFILVYENTIESRLAFSQCSRIQSDILISEVYKNGKLFGFTLYFNRVLATAFQTFQSLALQPGGDPELLSVEIRSVLCLQKILYTSNQ